MGHSLSMAYRNTERSWGMWQKSDIGHGNGNNMTLNTQGWYRVQGTGLTWITSQEDNLRHGTQGGMDITLMQTRGTEVV